MKEGEGVLVPKPRTAALLWVRFGFKPNDKGEHRNVDKAKKKSANTKKTSPDPPSTARRQTTS